MFIEKNAEDRMGRKPKCKSFIELLVFGNVLYAGNPVINKTLCPRSSGPAEGPACTVGQGFQAMAQCW